MMFGASRWLELIASGTAIADAATIAASSDQPLVRFFSGFLIANPFWWDDWDLGDEGASSVRFTGSRSSPTLYRPPLRGTARIGSEPARDLHRRRERRAPQQRPTLRGRLSEAPPRGDAAYPLASPEKHDADEANCGTGDHGGHSWIAKRLELGTVAAHRDEADRRDEAPTPASRAPETK